MPSPPSTITVSCGQNSGSGSGLPTCLAAANSPARNEVLRHLPDLSGTRLLDVAIGDGRNMPLIPRDCQVFGVDISRVLLEKCQQDYADRKIHLIVGEAESLPFPDSTFDNLLSVGVLNHVNDPGQVLGKWRSRKARRHRGGRRRGTRSSESPDRLQAWAAQTAKMDLVGRVFFLGRMSEVILEHTDLNIEPLVDQCYATGRLTRYGAKLGIAWLASPKRHDVGANHVVAKPVSSANKAAERPSAQRSQAERGTRP